MYLSDINADVVSVFAANKANLILEIGQRSLVEKKRTSMRGECVSMVRGTYDL